MNLVMLRTLQLTPLLALFSINTLTPAPVPAPVKCGGPGPNGTHYVVNGIITAGMNDAKIRGIGSNNTFLSDVLCMNPQDSTFNRSTGEWVVSVWTKDGPAPHVVLALDLIRYEQDIYFKRNKRYMSAATDIVLPLGMERVRVTLQGDEHGWVAHTTIPRLMQTCTMFDGRVYATGAATEPRRVVCKRDERSDP
jgi:hypothetical protein